MADKPTPEEFQQQLAELRRQMDKRDAEFHAKVIADFPFERVETTGELAFETWRQLKGAGRGAPVVLGGDRSVAMMMDVLGFPERSAADILAAADGLRHLEDLIARRERDEAEAREHLAQRAAELPSDAAGQLAQPTQVDVRALFEHLAALAGERPPEFARRPGLSVADDSATGKPLARVHIALIPTEDWTTIPAHLLWGGWNDCPHPEYHVAALRSWCDRYGAQLVGLSHDRMDLTVTHRPETRAQALELVREQHVYCTDLFVQRGGTLITRGLNVGGRDPDVVQALRALADELMMTDWWDFWWD